MRSTLGPLAVLAAGCTCLELPQARFRCDADGGCPSGLTCSTEGYCLGDEPLGDAGAGDFSKLCDGEWCFEHPLPAGHATLRSVFQLAKNDAWVAGQGGLLLHWDGERFAQVPTRVSATLYRVWGAARNDVWVAGGAGTLLHWNGVKLESYDAGTGAELRGLAGLARNAVWAVGQAGTVLKWDGRTWTRQLVPMGTLGLNDVEPWSETRVLAMGDSAVEWNGNSWSTVSRPWEQMGTIFNLWAPTPDAVWAVGSNGGMFLNTTGDFTDGGAWQQLDAGAPTVSAFVELEPGHRYWCSAASPGGGLWELSQGQVTQPSADPLYAVSARTADDVWAVGQSSLLHRTAPAAVFDDFLPTPDFSERLNGVAQLSDGAAWAVGDYRSVFTRGRDGGWTRVRIAAGGGGGPFWDVWSDSAERAIVVGDMPQYAAYWDAGAREMAPVTGLNPPGNLYGVWAASASDIWVVGDQSFVARYDGNAWQNDLTPGLNVRFWKVWGASATDVWIVGEAGRVLHWNGGTFDDDSLPGGPDLESVGGTSAADVYVGTTNNRVYRRTGPAAWVDENAQLSGNVMRLLGIEGTMYLTTDRGMVARRVGGVWQVMPVPVDSNSFQSFFELGGISAAPGQGIVIVGREAVILRKK